MEPINKMHEGLLPVIEASEDVMDIMQDVRCSAWEKFPDRVHNELLDRREKEVQQLHNAVMAYAQKQIRGE